MRTIMSAVPSTTGSSTFLGVGLFPGFWGEAIAPVRSRLSFRCDQIVVRESLSYAGYPSKEMMFDVMGYGRSPDSDDAMPGDISRAGYAFVGTAAIVAKALGLDVTSVEPFREAPRGRSTPRWVVSRRLCTRSMRFPWSAPCRRACSTWPM